METSTAPKSTATTIADMATAVDEAFSQNFWFLDNRTDYTNSTTMVWREVNVSYTARIAIQAGNTHVDIYKGSDGPRVFHIELDMTINDPVLNATIVAAIAARFDS